MIPFNSMKLYRLVLLYDYAVGSVGSGKTWYKHAVKRLLVTANFPNQSRGGCAAENSVASNSKTNETCGALGPQCWY